MKLIGNGRRILKIGNPALKLGGEDKLTEKETWVSGVVGNTRLGKSIEIAVDEEILMKEKNILIKKDIS